LDQNGSIAVRAFNLTKNLALYLSLAALTGLGCTTAEAKRKPKPEPVAAPAPPPPIIIPARPTPPLWAPATLIVPPVDALGVRQTINARISAVQTTWNFRSAYNVAALNCRDVKYDPIVAGYKAFLKTHVVGLNTANRGVDGLFRARHGAAFVRPREAYMTQVYNFYSFPPTLNQFCDAALAMSAQSGGVLKTQLSSFAATQLPLLDAVFENFYRTYEKYRMDAAAWDAKYRPPAPALVPGTASIPVPTPVSTTRP
jgi:hypothetical protein